MKLLEQLRNLSGLLYYLFTFSFFAFNTYAQTDSLNAMVDTLAGKTEMELQQSVEEQALGDTPTLRQFIIDSLQLIYDEATMEQKDSIVTLFNNQITDILNQCSAEKMALIDSLQALSDSIAMLDLRSPVLEDIGQGFDLILETKYFNYAKFLKRQEAKSKAGLFGSSVIEEIHPFQIKELEMYLDRFYPEARCDSIQDFLTQLYLRQKDWANAELSIIKFIFLYPESPLFEEIQTIRAGVFQTERAYKDYVEFLSSIVNTTPAYPKLDVRYFKYIELLKDFPDPAVRDKFIQEAKRYLSLYPFSTQASKVAQWIAESYIKKERPQSAYITYHRLMIFYPKSAEMKTALYQTAVLEEKEFVEHKVAIATFTKFIEKFPEDTLTAYAHQQIAKISAEQLQNWEKAIEEYQVCADLFRTNGKEKLCISALMTRAAILSDQMAQTEASVKTYLSIDEHYPGTPSAANAIMAAGDLYSRQKEFDKAIAQYMSIHEKYPDAENALPALENTYKIYDEELADPDKTIEILNLIINNYPGTKSESRAIKLLKKLEKAK